MRLYKTATFHKFAHQQGISDQTLLEAIFNAEQGLIDANLGSGIIKQRLAKQGRGKSGGYRTIIFYRVNDLAIFAYGFEKNEKENLSNAEFKSLKTFAKQLLNLSNLELEMLVKQGKILPLLLNS